MLIDSSMIRAKGSTSLEIATEMPVRILKRGYHGTRRRYEADDLRFDVLGQKEEL